VPTSAVSRASRSATMTASSGARFRSASRRTSEPRESR
jgi:hypothetical protein